MEIKKYIGLAPFLAGILALVGTFLTVSKIESGSTIFSMDIWITCTGLISGDLWYGQYLGFCSLQGLASLSSQAMVPVVIGYIITGISVAIIAIGAMQLILSEDNRILILSFVLGAALVVLIILQYIILSSIPSALAGNTLVLVAGFLFDSKLINAVLMLANVATKPGLGFYYIIIGAIVVVVIELVVFLLKRQTTTA
jgi:hypothetical protein